jgi:hypothetical protein
MILRVAKRAHSYSRRVSVMLSHAPSYCCVTDKTWPVSARDGGGCTRFGLPDGIGPAEAGTRLRTFEESGIDDWQRTALAMLVPADRPFGALASAPTWRLTGHSRLKRAGRAAWRAGVRWRHAGAGMIWTTAPASATEARTKILASLGYRDEPRPELIIVPATATATATATAAASDSVDEATWTRAQAWCVTPKQWSSPEALLTTGVAERVIALHDSWLFIAVASPAVAETRRSIEALASGWNLRIVSGPGAWSWFQ